MNIQILAPDVAAKIAAGEVVERPANVTKELLENSLDAGATEIRVEIREGGQRLLRVTDNGHGIQADEAALVFQRHATSKLTSADDLNHIATFGFRGEALYSIAAVSQVTLTTRHRGEEFGAQIRAEGGEIVAQNRAGSPVGAMVSVEHLFYNVPARRKFLRKPAAEAGLIGTVVQHCALAYPDRRFSLVSDGRLVFQSTGSGDLFDVLTKVYGLENARQMAPIGMGSVEQGQGQAGLDVLEDRLDDEVDFMDGEQSGKAASFAGAASPIRIAGYVSLPTLTRANRSNIDLFVNKRHIEDRGLTHAVVQAYHTFLPVGRYPVAVILIEVDPGEVDVNVHPQKIQVRFAEERRIFIAVQRAARRTLIQRLPVPTMEVGSAWSASYAEPGQPGAPATNSGWIERREHILNAGRQSSFELFVPPTFPSPVEGTETVPELARSSSGALTHSDHDQGKSMAEPPSQTAMADRGPRLPPLRVVGQVGAMYIIAEGPEGLYLIDQHAAHERILYEKLMAQRYGALNGVVARQYLLEPLTLHVGSQLAGLMAQYLTALQGIGFEIEQFGGDTFLVRAIPGVLAGQDPLRALEEIAQAMAVQRNVVGEELETRLIKMVCKRASIKAGQLLSAIEMQELVRQLEECQSPWTCPHGRPTMLQLSAGELEKAFGRT